MTAGSGGSSTAAPSVWRANQRLSNANWQFALQKYIAPESASQMTNGSDFFSHLAKKERAR
jgi:hypothetical protein